jgi:3-deoxy-7-phosphoheptulonate synthase
LLPPASLVDELGTEHELADQISGWRKDIARVMRGQDDRLLVIVGPCSIHDPEAAIEYAARLRCAAATHKSELLIVMRVYFEKPRTTVGWKGLINDPDLDGTFKVNKGLRVARELMLDINRMGLPVGCEFLDTISPQFMADLVSWGAIGARTTESQVHRELSSGLSMPVGFKNGTSGDCQIAVDAIRAASHPHSFLSVSKQGIAGIVETQGNEDCHIILRGGSDGPNYSAEHCAVACEVLKKNSLTPTLIVDCSHGNSRKLHTNQPLVAADLAKRIAAGDQQVAGVMLESFLLCGNQKIAPPESMAYGKRCVRGSQPSEYSCRSPCADQ